MSESSRDVLHLLRQGTYEELDRLLSTAQREFEAGRAGEQDLQRLFAPFDLGDTTLGEAFSGWFEAKYESYAALVALAMWQTRRAFDLRGSTTANRVSDKGWRGMAHFMQQAENAARYATTLTANPLSAWLVIGLIHNGQGNTLQPGDIEARRYPDWYAEPLSHNPHSMAVRRVMLTHLRTEWGGSEAQMLAFMRQQQDDALLSQGDLQQLWGRFHAQLAHHAWLFADNEAKALEHARLAANLNEAHAELLFALLTDTRAPQAERAGALDRFLSDLERHPEHGLRYADSVLHRDPDVLRPQVERLNTVLVHMVEAGNADAALTLGRLYEEVPHLGFVDPTHLLVQARERGSVEAATMLAFGTRLSDFTQRRGHRLAAADAGSDRASWVLWQQFDQYKQEFGLDERAQFRYLHRAADAGNNEARLTLAQHLRAGRVEMGEDSVLRPVDTHPIQESLDYAKHLLERAANEGHQPAQKLLKRTQDTQWQATTARRLSLPRSVTARTRSTRNGDPSGDTAQKAAGISPGRIPFLMLGLVLIVLRACNHSDPPTHANGALSPETYSKLEQLGVDTSNLP